jgi:FMN-dependent NADH-azoreductase
MPTLLHLDSSPLASSISRELTREFVSNWKASHPSGRVIYRDLAANPPSPVDQAWIQAVFTPAEAREAEQKALLAYSDECIAELEQADEYVLGVAMHNFSIPSVVKLWIDQVVRSGRTFSFGPDGVQGLLTGKKATILAATGGVYDAGTPAATLNFIDPYLRTVLGFIGVKDLKFVTAGGTAQLRTGDLDRAVFLQPHLEQVRSIASLVAS